MIFDYHQLTRRGLLKKNGKGKGFSFLKAFALKRRSAHGGVSWGGKRRGFKEG